MACVCVTHHNNNCHIMPPTDTPWHQLTHYDTNWHNMTPTDVLWHQLTRHVTNRHMTLTDTWHSLTHHSLTHDAHWHMTLTDAGHSLTHDTNWQIPDWHITHRHILSQYWLIYKASLTRFTFLRTLRVKNWRSWYLVYAFTQLLQLYIYTWFRFL